MEEAPSIDPPSDETVHFERHLDPQKVTAEPRTWAFVKDVSGVAEQYDALIGQSWFVPALVLGKWLTPKPPFITEPSPNQTRLQAISWRLWSLGFTGFRAEWPLFVPFLLP
jgi:hypothetical protein